MMSKSADTSRLRKSAAECYRQGQRASYIVWCFGKPINRWGRVAMFLNMATTPTLSHALRSAAQIDLFAFDL